MCSYRPDFETHSTNARPVGANTLHLRVYTKYRGKILSNHIPRYRSVQAQQTDRQTDTQIDKYSLYLTRIENYELIGVADILHRCDGPLGILQTLDKHIVRVVARFAGLATQMVVIGKRLDHRIHVAHDEVAQHQWHGGIGQFGRDGRGAGGDGCCGGRDALLPFVIVADGHRACATADGRHDVGGLLCWKCVLDASIARILLGGAVGVLPAVAQEACKVVASAVPTIVVRHADASIQLLLLLDGQFGLFAKAPLRFSQMARLGIASPCKHQIALIGANGAMHIRCKHLVNMVLQR
jgi:hypothetical protein